MTVTMPDGTSPICGVCAQRAQREIARVCPQCDALGYEDCWTCNGGCAVYGCQKARSTSAPPAKLQQVGPVSPRASLLSFLHVMSDIKRTVQDLLRDDDPRARLSAIDLVIRSPAWGA